MNGPELKDNLIMQTIFRIRNLLKEGIKKLRNFGIKNNKEYLIMNHLLEIGLKGRYKIYLQVKPLNLTVNQLLGIIVIVLRNILILLIRGR